MSVLKKVTDKVTENTFGQGTFIDPAWIAIIASLVQEVVVLINQCTENAGQEYAVGMMQKPTFLQKFVLKRHIQKSLGLKMSMKYGKNVYNSLLKTGAELPKEELQDLLEELKY